MDLDENEVHVLLKDGRRNTYYGNLTANQQEENNARFVVVFAMQNVEGDKQKPFGIREGTDPDFVSTDGFSAAPDAQEHAELKVFMLKESENKKQIYEVVKVEHCLVQLCSMLLFQR